MSLACKNLKVSFICKNYVNIKNVRHKYSITKRSISTIIKQSDLGCVFTIYNHSSNILHCTGIRYLHIIPKIIDFIKNELKSEILSSRIDNSLFTCKQTTIISLSDIINKVAESKDSIYYCTHTTEIFPGLFLKPILKKTGLPSVILFHNSSYVLIGGKSIGKVKAANLFVKALCAQPDIPSQIPEFGKGLPSCLV